MKDRDAYRRQLGNNVLNVREKACLKREAMQMLSGLAVATIFRLETTLKGFEYETLKQICDVFGFTTDEMANLNIDDYTEKELQKRVEKFRKSYRNDESTAIIVKNSFNSYKQTNYYIKQLLKQGYFEAPKTIRQIREQINTSYNIDIQPQDLTNCLKSKDYIIAKPIGKNKKEYSAKPVIQGAVKKHSNI